MFTRKKPSLKSQASSVLNQLPTPQNLQQRCFQSPIREIMKSILNGDLTLEDVCNIRHDPEYHADFYQFAVGLVLKPNEDKQWYLDGYRQMLDDIASFQI